MIIKKLNEKRQVKRTQILTARKRNKNIFFRILDEKKNSKKTNVKIFYRICEFLDIYSLENLRRYLERYMEYLNGWKFVINFEKRKKLIKVIFIV